MTGIIKKNPQPETVVESEPNRDESIETDWFPIFRSGDYSQGDYKPEDVDEIVEEFQLTGRRPPIVFDHLTPDDFKANAKPGSAAGFIIDARAVDTTDFRYPGTRELQVRAKVGWHASWRTRSGDYRNVSIGLYRCKSNAKKKEMHAIHHLALLGAAPPAVAGLPEVIFSERNSPESLDSILSFACEGGIPLPAPSGNTNTNQLRSTVITFTETEVKSKLELAEANFKLAHNGEIASFKEQIAKFQEELDEAKEELGTVKTELETTKASIPVIEEKAKQAGKAEGIAEAAVQSERLFAEQKVKLELKGFCEDLRKSGRLTEQELNGVDGKPGMADKMFSMPEDVRQTFKDLLNSRPGVPVTPSGEQNFRGEKPVGGSFDADEKMAADARALVHEKKFSNFREALAHVKSTTTKSTEE